MDNLERSIGMNNIQVFKNAQFGSIRAVELNGEPWLVGKDVASILGYTKLDAMYRVVEEADKLSIDPQSVGIAGFPPNGAILEPNPNVRRMILINESGLYDAIFSSKLPQAKQFRHWVTSEVLPSIRKHGGYIKDQENLTEDELLSRALLVAQSRIAERDRQIERMRPKEIFADAVTASHNSILVGELAKVLRQNGVEIGQNRLFEWLRGNGYLIKRKGSDWNMPTQMAMELGLFEIKETVITHADGHTSINKTVKVTGKGQQYFINKFLGMA
jgi:anti-repressor protein